MSNIAIVLKGKKVQDILSDNEETLVLAVDHDIVGGDPEELYTLPDGGKAFMAYLEVKVAPEKVEAYFDCHDSQTEISLDPAVAAELRELLKDVPEEEQLEVIGKWMDENFPGAFEDEE
ncbi:MAG: hypothetical protein ABSF90_08460 [Syntrophobacteraceae bacterium]|jgi:hypothetical protein